MSDLGKLKKVFIDILDGLHSQKMMNRLGLAQRKFIRDRTAQGKDVQGKSWRKPDYHPAYAKKRQRETGLGPHPVTLTFDDITGMMQNIDHIVFGDFTGVELLFTDERKRKLAEYHNILGAGRNRVIRKFWGVSEKEEEALAEIVEDELDLILQKLNEE